MRAAHPDPEHQLHVSGMPEVALRRELLLQMLDEGVQGHAGGPAASAKGNALLLPSAVGDGELPLIDGTHTAVQHQLNAAPAQAAMLSATDTTASHLGECTTIRKAEQASDPRCYELLLEAAPGTSPGRVPMGCTAALAQLCRVTDCWRWPAALQRGTVLHRQELHRKPHLWKRVEVYSLILRS